MSSLILGGVIITAVILIIKHGLYKSKKQIPGPYGIPFIGSALELLCNNPLDLLEKWKQTYGDICQIKLMGKPVVILSGPEYIREMLVIQSTEFAGRADSFRFKYVYNFQHEVAATTYSPKWVKTKKMFMNTLKMYGERLNLLESITMEILQQTVIDIEKTNGKPFDIKPALQLAVTNIMASIVSMIKLDLNNGWNQLLPSFYT